MLRRLPGHRLRVAPLLLVTLALPIACVTETPEVKPPAQCVPTERYFADDVWGAFMSSSCFACHNAQGAARGTDLVLQSSNQPGFLEANLATVQNVAALERDGVSILLLKPSMQVDHGGGLVIEKDGAEYKALQELISRFKSPVQCENTEAEFNFDGVVMLDEQETLRKSALALVGRLPTAEEYERVAGGDVADVEAVLDEMLQEEAFYGRVKEIYNDLFLTNRYLGGNRAVDLLDDDDYPNRRWHEALDETQYSPEYIEAARENTNNSVAQEPLELIAYIVKNDLPFSEIVTADYMMVNGYSAQVYGITDVEFDNPADPGEFRPGRIPGVPHAGVLSSPMFLNRFPTTATNRNRHRSRMAYQFFLATDVMKLAERPVDPASIVDHNPTMNNPQCTVCHENIDPVAGTFQNWDETGRYRPPESGWFSDMRTPGYKGATVPPERWSSSLSWLGEQLAQDPLFALSAVHTLYKGLTGQTPLTVPPDPAAADYQAKMTAYEAQDKIFKEIAQRFVDDNYNLKTLVKGILLSPYFRAEEAAVEQVELAELGTARFLTPELLHRKIEATTGYPWVRRYDQRPYLLRSDEFLIFYGGIDSDAVTQRITEPNGLMSAIGQRMANEMSCTAGPRDFTLDAADRKLFPLVEMTYEPEDANGFEVTGAVQAIKANIQHLHERLLGEKLTVDDPEVERTYNLFLETWREGKQLVAEDQVDDYLPYQCRAERDFWTDEELPEERRVNRDANYTVRAWMAVLSYLLSDYRFLHE